MPTAFPRRFGPRVPVALLVAGAALLAGAQPAAALSRGTLVSKAAKAMKRAGGSSGALVRDLSTGETLFARHAGVRRVPASVEKLYTTSAALLRMGPATRLYTDAVTSAPIDADGLLDGNLVLRGGGDPTLSRADLGRLAGRVGASGIRRVAGSVVGDESRFDGRRGTSGWGYTPWLGGSLGALAVGRGWGRGGPGLSTARAFVKALRARGVRVAGRTRTGRAPPAARRVARVASPTVATLARMTNSPSDNFLAETLLKELGARFGSAGTTAAGARVSRRVARRFGARPRVVDGSGLSRSNRTSPRDVVALIEGIRSTSSRSSFERSLAVAGRSGTLGSRMRGTAAAGRCRGKTGTLSDVSSLAAICRSASGHTIAFAVLMNSIGPDRGRPLQDAIAVAVARYGG